MNKTIKSIVISACLIIPNGLITTSVEARNNEFRQIERLAKKGDMDAEYRLGLAYRDGINVKVDNEKALTWISKAAQAGHPAAQAHYGLMLYQSDLKSQSEYWLKVAAVNGDAKSQYILGIEYWNGGVVSQDPYAAERFLKMASDQGLEPAREAYAQVYAINHPPLPTPQPKYATGRYLVQLGIFYSEGQAQSKWNRIVDRIDFEGRVPIIEKVPLGYALRIYGYTRVDSQNTCRRVKNIGQDCYARHE